MIYDGFSPNALGVPGAVARDSFLDAISGTSINSISATRHRPWTWRMPARRTRRSGSRSRIEVDFQNGTAFTAETRDDLPAGGARGPRRTSRSCGCSSNPIRTWSTAPISWLSTDVRVFQLRPAADGESGERGGAGRSEYQRRRAVQATFSR